jgi:hypothetical protein
LLRQLVLVLPLLRLPVPVRSVGQTDLYSGLSAAVSAAAA